jgi:Domain of unknown function (DUF6379)
MVPGNVFGYEFYMIQPDGFRNVKRAGEVIGFQLRLRLANYRGYILSQVEDVRVMVDDDRVARGDIRFGIENRSYRLDEMESATNDRWEILQVATVTCLKPGGLASGKHTLNVEEHVRASYIPMVAVASARRELTLEPGFAGE